MAATSRSAQILVLLAACVSPPEPPVDHRSFEDVRRIVVALDDVRDEYHLAVDGSGRVTDPVKLRVLGAIMHDVILQSRRFPASERAVLDLLAAAVSRHVPPPEVVRVAGTTRRHLLRSRHLVLAPAAPPDRTRVEALWRSQCAACHGDRGGGDGAQGLHLEPGPKSFQDEDVVTGIAPSRASSRIADGLRGTAMPSFGHFTADERWGFAFLVLTFRHEAAAIARGRALATRSRRTLSPTWLADRSDRELLADLATDGLAPRDATDVLAFARGEAAFAPTAGPSAHVRAHFVDGVLAYRARRLVDAQRRLMTARDDALLLAARVRLVDRDVAARIEVCARRVAVLANRVPMAERIEREVARCMTELDRGDPRLRARSRWAPAWVAVERGVAAALALGLGVAILWRRRTPRSLPIALLATVLVAELVVVVVELAAATAALALLAALGVALVAGRALPVTWATRAGLVAAALAGAATAGRLGWSRWLRDGHGGEPLALPRVELVGLYPATLALVAAFAGALLVAVAWRCARVDGGGLTTR